ncbi:osteopontin [Xenentodon cancila]
MVETQGQPLDSMLNRGTRTTLFFQRDHNSTSSFWKLRIQKGPLLPGTLQIKMLFVEMLKGMLQLDAAQRMTPQQALEHQFLSLDHIASMNLLSFPSVSNNVDAVQAPNCETMKVALVFVLLFATVLCRPARKIFDSTSESSEEVVRRPAPPARKQPLVQVVVAASVGSESTETSEEDAAAAAQLEVKAGSTDAVSATDAPVNSSESEDSDDDDDEKEESETEEEEEESSDSSDSESGEASTPAPGTVTPVVVTVEPTAETTVDTILPTIVIDTDQGRGDSLGGYPSDYKSIIYVEDKTYHKVPVPYKSYEFLGTGKKMVYDMTDGNEVEKSPKKYKGFQIHSDLLEEDTSTPEVESQGLDVTSDTAHDQDMSPRQAALPEEEESASTNDATTSESGSSSNPEEEEEEEEESASTTSDSASASEESEDEESQSSEEATATPGAADSDSDESDSIESDSDEEGAGPDATTELPVVITAK